MLLIRCRVFLVAFSPPPGILAFGERAHQLVFQRRYLGAQGVQFGDRLLAGRIHGCRGRQSVDISIGLGVLRRSDALAEGFVEAPNLRYRALTESESELRATEQSFATSILWGGKIEASDPDGRALVDFTSFVVRDAHGVVRRLAEAEQGEFGLGGCSTGE